MKINKQLKNLGLVAGKKKTKQMIYAGTASIIILLLCVLFNILS
jgi:hypothetical protein